jgi:hypothetical protein
MDQQQPQTVKARRVDPPALPQPAAVQNLARLLGLDIRAALLAILVDLLVFSIDSLSMELLLPLGGVLAVALGLVVYHIQKQHDAHRVALIKGLAIGILTFIPVPITPIFSLPAVLLSFFQAATTQRDRDE